MTPQSGGISAPRPTVPRPKVGAPGVTQAQEQVFKPLPPPKAGEFSVASHDNERGWLDQNVHDVWSLISGIPQIVWQAGKNLADGTVVDAIYDMGDSLLHDPDVLAQASWRTLKDTLYGATEHYRNPRDQYTLPSVAMAPLKRPFLVALDGLTLLSGGTAAGLKMTRPMTRLAAVAGVKPMTFMRGWTRALTAASKAPGKAFAAGIASVERLPGVRHVEQALAATPLVREAYRLGGSQRLRTLRMAFEQDKALRASKIPVELRQAYSDILNVKTSWDPSLYPEAFNRRVLDWHEAQAQWVDRFREEGVKLASGELTDAALETSRIKHLANELPAPYTGDVARAAAIREANLAETARVGGPLAAKVQSALYRPSVRAMSMDVAEAFHQMFEPVGMATLKKAGPLERFLGRRKYEIDPDFYQSHYLRSMADLLGHKRSLEAMLGKYGKLIQPLKQGEFLPDGHELLPHFVSPRYIDDKITAVGRLNLAVAKHEKTFGVGSPAAREAAWAEVAEGLAPEAFSAEGAIFGKDLQWVAPKDLVRAITQDLAPEGALMRTYDMGLNAWRDLVLNWSSRFYVNNLLGNAALMLFYGILPTYQKGRNFANVAHEAARATLRSEARGVWGHGALPAAVESLAPVKKVRHWQEEAAFVTDAIPRIKLLGAEASQAASELQAAHKIASPFIQASDGSAPLLDEIAQAMANVRERALELEGKLLTIAGQGLDDAARGAIVGAAKKESAGLRRADRASRAAALASVEAGQAPSKALASTTIPVIQQAISELPRRISAESPIKRVRRSEYSGVEFDEATVFMDKNADWTLRVMNEKSPQALREAKNELIAAWAWENLKPNEYAEWREAMGYPASREVRGGVGGGMSNVDTFAQSVIVWSEGKPWSGTEGILERIFAEPTVPAKQFPRMPTAKEVRHRLYGGQLRDAIESAGLHQDYLNAIKPLREPYEKAIRTMELFTGSYGRTTPFARKYLRRVIPFWTFASTMTNLAFWAPFIRPKTTWLYSNMAQMAQEAFDDERLPNWLRGTMWVGGDGKGNMNFVRLSGLNLFDSMSFRKLGNVPFPKLIDPTQNPFFTVAVKLIGGYEQFTHEPPPVDGYQWMDNHGRVWEMSGGKFERVSPQTPLLDAFGELIPQLSMLNDVLAHVGVKVPGRGPKLYRGPDGKMFAPRHWMTGVGKFLGVNAGQVNLNQAREADQANTLRLARMFAKKAMMSPNEVERDQILKELAEMERRFGRRGYAPKR